MEREVPCNIRVPRDIEILSENHYSANGIGTSRVGSDWAG